MKCKKYYETREDHERSIAEANRAEGRYEGRKEGLEVGREEGLEKGREEGERIGMQKILKEMNRTMDPNQIAACLNRPLRDVLLLLGKV